MPRRHRHPGLNCFRRSIPRLHAPLSTLRVLPRGSDPRMTRGQCGSLLLHCNGLSPSISCRSSRRTAAQYLARGLPCERFTAALASRTSCITRGRGGWLNLPRGGLPPPILCQLSWRTPRWVKSRRSDHAPSISGLPRWSQPVAATLYLRGKRWSVGWNGDFVEVLLRQRRRSYGIAGSVGSR